MRCLTLLLLLTSLVSCSQIAEDKQLYYSALEEWRTRRITDLNAEDGWMSLVGLYRLDTSRKLLLGSGDDNDLVLPADFPNYFATIDVAEDDIQMVATVSFEIGGERHNEASLIPTGRKQEPTVVDFGRHQFIILDRSGEYFMRLRDLELPSKKPLSDLPHFGGDPAWAVSAQLLDQTKGDTFKVKNVLGQDVLYISQGLLEFEVEGNMHQLVAFGGTTTYFVMFSDETTSVETYGGGRYLYVPLVDREGVTTVDFNRAENPPCVFTDFATCPFPPEENHLAIRVTAGEKVLANDVRH